MEVCNIIPILVIMGPTASGKTDLSVRLALKYDAEIVSCDSMQIYKGMDIGTAKPTKEEMCGVVHHLIDCIDKSESFSVAQFCELAHTIIKDINNRGKNVILTGGTGLYIKSVVDNITFMKEEDNTLIKEELLKYLNDFGKEALYNRLVNVDKTAAESIHPNNVPRVLRALEIIEKTGHSFSDVLEKSRENESPYNPLFIGLDYRKRQVLYNRINKRVDLMVENGLLDEVKKVSLDKNQGTSIQAIGYKEMIPYINGCMTLKEAISNLKQSTRHYAKRQLTWNRKEERIKYFYPDDYDCSISLLSDVIFYVDNSKLFLY